MRKKWVAFLGMSLHEPNKTVVNESNLPPFPPTRAEFLQTMRKLNFFAYLSKNLHAPRLKNRWDLGSDISPEFHIFLIKATLIYQPSASPAYGLTDPERVNLVLGEQLSG